MTVNAVCAKIHPFIEKEVMKRSVLLLFVLTIFCSYAAENSIIPLMEQFESLQNLPSQKMTKNQMYEIASALAQRDTKIRLVTYNMLFDLYDHNLEEENRWPNRLPRIAHLISEMAPDIISTQELYPNQVMDLSTLLEKDFAFFVGQKDDDGESYGIFYRKDRFELVSSRVISPLSMVELKDLKTAKIVYVFNTHMPLSNIEKREAHARKIVQIIKPFAKKSAAIFTGDLNTFPERFDLTKLPFYDGDYIHRILSKGPLKNSKDRSLLGHFGPISTFTNLDPDIHPFKGTGTPGIVLDYIYVSPRITVLTHATEPATVEGHFPSDHMPVLIDFLID